MQKVFNKVIKCGNVIEVYKYSERMINKKTADKGGRKKNGKEGSKERKEEYQKTVNYRAREKIRRLILSNFDDQSIFLTLTFAENIRDLQRANKEFKKFIQRIRRRQDDFKYVCVIEFQKRGAVHYHLVCNLQKVWIDEEGRKGYSREIAEIWGNGFCDVRELTNVDNIGAYVVKYLQKNFKDDRLSGQKRFFYSKGLVQPEELMLDDGKQAWLDTLEGEFYPVYSSVYSGFFTGLVEYREYNLKRGKMV